MECGDIGACANGMESVYGSTCQGCSPYGGGSSYWSCWPIDEWDDCTDDSGCYGLRCIDDNCTARWPCVDTADCSPAYTCGPGGVCTPYYESLCWADEDCPDSYNYRCHPLFGVCMPEV